MQVEDDRVRTQGLGQLDRFEPVGRPPDDGQLRLAVDEGLERLEKGAVVVSDQDADVRLIRTGVIHVSATLALPRCTLNKLINRSP